MNIIVRLPNWIGDVILSLPALESLEANYPGAEVWLAANGWAKDIFAGTKHEGRVIPAHPLRGFSDYRTAARELRSHAFDLGILLTNSFSSAWLFRMAGIPERWGYKRDGRGPLLTKRARPPKSDPPPHMVRYYLGLLEGFGLRTVPPNIHLAVTDDERQRARQRLTALGADPKNRLAVLAPGAAFGPAKRWPAGRFAELARLLRDRHDAQVLVVGSAGDAALAEDIVAPPTRRALNLAGGTTLRELLAVMAIASVVVTNDSGPMHMANALRVPVVGIFGPTDPRVTAPFDSPSAVVKKDDIPCWPCSYRTCPYDHRCMQRITADDILGAAAPFLA